MAHHETILNALTDAGVEFIVGGGMACILQGVERLTMDVYVAVMMQKRIGNGSAVKPPGRFGALHIEAESVTGFREKPGVISPLPSSRSTRYRTHHL